MTFAPWLAVAAGGALGALSRYSVGMIPILTSTPHFKTMAINIAGCLAIGLIWGTLESWPGGVSKLWYNVLIAGFLGGFTTYSSFSLETMRLVGNGQLLHALLYVLLTVIGCIGACALGLYLASR